VTDTAQIVDTPALKEWAAIVHALLEGEQIVDLRKGGLREDGRHFGVDATRCWLYPTAEHQRPELLRDAYRRYVDLATASPVGGPITIPGWAEIVGVATISDEATVEALAGKTIWSSDYAQSRLKWKKRDPLWVLTLRVYRLREPVTIGWRDEYGGCTSWVPLGDLPADPRDLPAEPALSDVAFAGRRKGVDDLLQP